MSVKEWLEKRPTLVLNRPLVAAFSGELADFGTAWGDLAFGIHLQDKNRALSALSRVEEAVKRAGLWKELSIDIGAIKVYVNEGNWEKARTFADMLAESFLINFERKYRVVPRLKP